MDIPHEESGESNSDVPNPRGQSGSAAEESSLWNRLPSREEMLREHSEMLRACSEMRALYDSGTPFYTKDAIRDLHAQLMDHGREMFSVRALDGNLVEFSNITDQVCSFSGDSDDTETVVTAPVIQYVPVENLTDCRLGGVGLKAAYCSLQIVFPMRPRYKLSGEMVKPQLRAYDELGSDFDTILVTWSKSEAFQQLKATIDPILPQCKKIVAFALGDMSRTAIEGYRYNRRVFHHTLIVTLRDILMSHVLNTVENIPCFAQDPAYNDVDQAVLEQHRVCVVEDPAGFLEVDNSTAVISVSPDVAMKGVVTDLAYPALIIWDELHDEDGPPVSQTDPGSPRVREMLRDHYDSFKFPEYKTYTNRLAIHVRRW